MTCSARPRYEAMTPGSCSTSSGAPAAMTPPWSIATIRSETNDTRAMSCSITSRLAPRLSRTRSSNGPSASVSRCAMPLDGSSDHDRALREDAGQVHDATRPRRQLVDELGAERLQPQQVDELVDPRAHLLLRIEHTRQVEGGGHGVAHLDPALERDGDRLFHGEGGEEPRVLERAPEAAAGTGVGGERAHVDATEFHRAGAARGEAAEHVEESRLPRAVGPDHADHLARRARERHAVEG